MVCKRSKTAGANDGRQESAQERVAYLVVLKLFDVVLEVVGFVLDVDELLDEILDDVDVVVGVVLVLEVVDDELLEVVLVVVGLILVLEDVELSIDVSNCFRL